MWSRLLGLLTLVVVPSALLTLLLAYSLFAAALDNLQNTEAGAARGRAANLRAWIDASGHALANEAAAATLLDAQRCQRLAATFVANNPAFAFARFYDENAQPCEGGAPSGAPPSPRASAGEGYRVAVADGRLWIVSGAANAPAALAAQNAALRERLRVAAALGETHMALIGPDDEALALDPDSADFGWRPANRAGDDAVFRGPDRNGATAAFVNAPVAPGLSVLMRFDDGLYTAEWRRFLVLCLAQIAMLGLIAWVSARALRRDVVAWIEGIDVAARARGDDPLRRAAAPVSATMPRDLRNVAVSFNVLTEQAADREAALQLSLAHNRALMLEMHHRLKNSLQVIQSYLALIRRNGPRHEAALTARIEARVGVLAAAYRLALSSSGMRPIAVKPFLEEIFAAAHAGLRQPRQRATCEIAWEGELILDRAIPLGLALAEALIAAFAADDVEIVAVTLAPTPEGGAELRVECDAASIAPGLPERVMRGLAAQLGASSTQASPGAILRWRFDP